ncbi:MAG TPA: acyltransferase family protein, partial [Candidatus Thermoplasmatota archaeon]
AAMLEQRGWRPSVPSIILAPAAFLFLVIAPNLLALPPQGTWSAVDERTAFTIWRSVPAIGFGILVFLSANAAGVTKRILESAPAIHLGKISFSLYLVHFPIMHALPTFAPWTLSYGTTGFVLATFVASWPAAVLLYGLVEAPSLAWKSRLTTPAASLPPKPTYQVERRSSRPEWPTPPAQPSNERR